MASSTVPVARRIRCFCAWPAPLVPPVPRQRPLRNPPPLAGVLSLAGRTPPKALQVQSFQLRASPCMGSKPRIELVTARALSASPPFSPSKQPLKASPCPAAGSSESQQRSVAAAPLEAVRGYGVPSRDSEEGASKIHTAPTPLAKDEPPVQRRRGRPAGIPAWNKNKKMPEATRRKISKTKKDQWKDPNYRKEKYSEFTTLGRPAWNKGATLGEETRQKMSRAKQGGTLTKLTRRKLSAAKASRPQGHTPETCAILSANMRGRAKSPAHRAAIAAGQRRRHAAARVLAAVEGVHRELSMAGVTSASSYEAAARRNGRGGSGGGGAPSKAQMLAAYKAQLHEYRNLQEELQPWTTAFTSKEGRKPNLRDVEATGIEWLIVKYKQYILLREHLLREIPTFRTNVGSNVSSPPAASFENGIPRAGQAPGLSASGAAATKVQAAREYRQRKGRLAAAGDGKRGAGAGAETQEPRELPVPGVETDQRVSGALQAAMKYREEKAKLSAAKARAAAAMAGGIERKPWSHDACAKEAVPKHGPSTDQ